MSRLSIDYDDPNGHLAFARFGLAQQNQVGQIDALMRELPAVRPTVAEQITLACYQTEYGIFDHDRPHGNRPLALVALHPKEDVVEGGPLFSYIRKYHTYRIHKLFGLSVSDFLELPPYVADFLLDIGQSEALRNESTQRQLHRQLEMDFNEP